MVQTVSQRCGGQAALKGLALPDNPYAITHSGDPLSAFRRATKRDNSA